MNKENKDISASDFKIKRLSDTSVITADYMQLDTSQDDYNLQKILKILSKQDTLSMDLDFYQTFFEYVPFTFSITDYSTQKILFCNENFAKVHGYKSIEECKEKFSVHVFYRNHAKRDRFLEVLRENNNLSTFEVCINDYEKFEEERWFRFSTYLDEKKCLLVSLGIDVTEQKKSQLKTKLLLKELQASEQKLRSFFDNAEAGFFRSNFITGEIIDCNLKFAKILGIEVLNKDEKIDLVTPAFKSLNVSTSWEGLREVVRLQGKVSNYEVVAESKSGSITYLNVSCSLNRASGILEGAITNVTEKKLALKALFQTELRYKNITEKTNGICCQYVFTHHKSAKLNFIGGKLDEYFGMPAERIYKNPLMCFKSLHREDRKSFFRAIYRKAFSKEPWTTKVRMINSDMKLRWLQVTATPTSFMDGDVIWSLVAIDITEQEKFEFERKSFESQLRISQKMEALGTLAGGIAHDFNNILQGITFAVESSLMEKNMSPKTYDRLMKAQKFLNRGSDLVKQILTYCRRESQECELMHLEDHMQEVIGLMRSGLPKNIKIEQNIQSHTSLVEANPVQIQQVIMNLCSNAGYVMKETGGLLKLSLFETYIGPRKSVKHKVKPGSFVVLSVQDTGPGIDEDVQERIFEPFFTTKPIGEGTGMGLAVVAGIVESHGGFIELKSTQGTGTTFDLYFPMHEEVQKEIEPEDEGRFKKPL